MLRKNGGVPQFWLNKNDLLFHECSLITSLQISVKAAVIQSGNGSGKSHSCVADDWSEQNSAVLLPLLQHLWVPLGRGNVLQL